MKSRFCDANHLCIAKTWLRKADKKKIGFGFKIKGTRKRGRQRKPG